MNNINKRIAVILSLVLSGLVQYIVMYKLLEDSGGTEAALFIPVFIGMIALPLWLINTANMRIIFKLFKIPSTEKRPFLLMGIIPILSVGGWVLFLMSMPFFARIEDTKLQKEYALEFSTPKIEIQSDGTCAFELDITSKAEKESPLAEIHFAVGATVKTTTRDDDFINICATNFRIYQTLKPGKNTITGIAEATHYNFQKKLPLAKTAKYEYSGYASFNGHHFDYKAPLNKKNADQIIENLGVWFMDY